MMTYRENIANLLKPLRWIQSVSLILLLVGFVLPFFGWESNVMLYGKILMLIGLMGEFYCWAKARQIKCPQCGKSLGYLLHDPSVVFKDKRCASSAKGTAARHPLLPVLQGKF